MTNSEVGDGWSNVVAFHKNGKLFSYFLMLRFRPCTDVSRRPPSTEKERVNSTTIESQMRGLRCLQGISIRNSFRKLQVRRQFPLVCNGSQNLGLFLVIFFSHCLLAI